MKEVLIKRMIASARRNIEKNKKYYYISFRVVESNMMVGLPFSAYYSEKRMKEMVKDPQIIIESMTGDFDINYVDHQAKKWGTKVVN